MITLPLQLRDGHLFVNLSGELWLIDTGAPSSFGRSRRLNIAGESFQPDAGFGGLNPETLSDFVGVACAGLLGADILGRFDHVWDCAGGTLTVSTGELTHRGQSIPLDGFMGIPIITARIGASDHRMFFDTGAQFSYFQSQTLTGFRSVGRVTDFHPGFGQFETELFEVQVSLGGIAFPLHCGSLPELLGLSLMMAGTEGIVGNAILNDRTVGYFPRRNTLVL
ncbi:MAG: hypothetical protein ACKO32_13355 [Planctomycetia bacterium]